MLTLNQAIFAVRPLLVGAALSLGCLGTASAATIFTDNFTRSASNNVGNGWSEFEQCTSCVGIVSLSGNGALQLRGEASGINAAALQGTVLNTTGYTGLQVSFDYRRIDNNTETSDNLYLSWAPSGTAINGAGWTTVPIAGFTSNSNTFVSSGLINLVGATGNIDIRFYTDVSNNDEGFYVDNVSVFGTATAVPGPIAGAGPLGLILASGGLLAWWRRRKTVQLAG